LNKKITRQKLFSDNLMQGLLKNHRKATYSKTLEQKTNILIQEEYNKLAERKLQRFFFGMKTSMLTPAGLAVAMLLVIMSGLGWIGYYGIPGKLTMPVSYALLDGDHSDVAVLTRRGLLESSAKPIKIETGQAQFVLESNSSLAIDKDQAGNSYRLKFGSIYVNADRVKAGSGLAVTTELGSIRVAGTRFSMTAANSRLIVECFEGSVLFVPAYGGSKNYPVTTGKRLSAVIDSFSGSINVEESEFTGTEPYTISRVMVEKTDGGEPKLENTELDGSTDQTDHGRNEEINSKTAGDLRSLDLTMTPRALFTSTSTITVISDVEARVISPSSGATITEIPVEANAAGFSTSDDMLYYLPEQGRIKGVSLLSGKTLFDSKTGPVAFSSPGTKENLTAIASTDGALYLLNSSNGTLLAKQQFSAGLISTPLFSGDTIITASLSKEIYVVSIHDLKIIWSLPHDTRLTPTRGSVSISERYVALTDESSRCIVIDLVTKSTSFTVSYDPGINPQFFNDYLAVIKKGSLRLYTMSGDEVLIQGAPGDVTGMAANREKLVVFHKNSLLLFSGLSAPETVALESPVTQYSISGGLLTFVDKNKRLFTMMFEGDK
jgi:outer membrane protein assembly factor BamB